MLIGIVWLLWSSFQSEIHISNYLLQIKQFRDNQGSYKSILKNKK